MVGDLKMNEKKIINLAEPSSSTDASTKNYVDSRVTIPGDINLNGNKIYFYLSKECSIYKNGDMLGLELPGFFVIRGSENNDYILFIDKYQINCYNKRLKDVKDPSDLKDAVNKKYVDLILEKAKEYINLKMASLRYPYAPGAERYFDYLFTKRTYTRGQKSRILQFMSHFSNYCETMVLKVGSLFRKAVLLVPICEFYK